MKQIELKQWKHSQHSYPMRLPPDQCHLLHRLLHSHRRWSTSGTGSVCSACHGRIVFVPVDCDSADLDPVNLVVADFSGSRVPTACSSRLPSRHHDAGRAEQSGRCLLPNTDPSCPGHGSRGLVLARIVVLRVRRVVFGRCVSSRVLLVCLDFSYLLHGLLPARRGHWQGMRREGGLAEESSGLFGGLARGLGLFELLELRRFLLLLEQLPLPLFALQVQENKVSNRARQRGHGTRTRQTDNRGPRGCRDGGAPGVGNRMIIDVIG
ncbi:hypothetical protein L227DRAFT_184661 [Lentinus tigrinus ALCF2SS1-6]|uniref:Uncharacterized protein n=1 Tax=Lentinus tigrinus ALCF2SS1-6 TaxID=1328759 RepID=A0A5C2S617_9APHY|nr:hypothetical protein L227DRAFT_184661 [Lentinus tigrinus ALCF2SS1-6]